VPGNFIIEATDRHGKMDPLNDKKGSGEKNASEITTPKTKA